MRDLKFRVWNGYEMVYNVTVGKFGAFYVNPGDKGDGLDPKDSACITPFNTKFHESTPVMQFTGLLDNQGKEVYEGDVLERIGTRDNFTALKMESQTRELIVVELNVSHGQFGDYSFGFSMPTQRTYSERSNPATYTVIGNIYENTELLNQ
jgi:uncharacterized phage protein (TIGR01671 family)